METSSITDLNLIEKIQTFTAIQSNPHYRDIYDEIIKLIKQREEDMEFLYDENKSTWERIEAMEMKLYGKVLDEFERLQNKEELGLE